MTSRLAFHPNLAEAILEDRVLPAIAPVLPMILNGSSLGSYLNVWGFSSGGSAAGGSGGGSSNLNATGIGFSTPGTALGSPMAVANALAAASGLGGTPGTPNGTAALAVRTQVGSGANRPSGAGGVGYGSAFAAGYGFGLNALNGYGDPLSPISNSPVGTEGVAGGSARSHSGVPSRTGQSLNDAGPSTDSLLGPRSSSSVPFDPNAGAPDLHRRPGPQPQAPSLNPGEFGQGPLNPPATPSY